MTPIKKAQERKTEVEEVRMLRWISGVTRKDRIRNAYINGTIKRRSIQKKYQESRVREVRRSMFPTKKSRKIGNYRVKEERKTKNVQKERLAGDLKEKGRKREVTLDRLFWKKNITATTAIRDVRKG